MIKLKIKRLSTLLLAAILIFSSVPLYTAAENTEITDAGDIQIDILESVTEENGEAVASDLCDYIGNGSVSLNFDPLYAKKGDNSLKLDYYTGTAGVFVLTNRDWLHACQTRGRQGIKIWIYNPSQSAVYLHLRPHNNTSFSVVSGRPYYLISPDERIEACSAVRQIYLSDMVDCLADMIIPGGFCGYAYLPFSSLVNQPETVGVISISVLAADGSAGCLYLDDYSVFAELPAAYSLLSIDSGTSCGETVTALSNLTAEITDFCGRQVLSLEKGAGIAGCSLICSGVSTEECVDFSGIKLEIKNLSDYAVKIGFSGDGNAGLSMLCGSVCVLRGEDEAPRRAVGEMLQPGEGGFTALTIPPGFNGSLFLPWEALDGNEFGLIDFSVYSDRAARLCIGGADCFRELPVTVEECISAPEFTLSLNDKFIQDSCGGLRLSTTLALAGRSEFSGDSSIIKAALDFGTDRLRVTGTGTLIIPSDLLDTELLTDTPGACVISRRSSFQRHDGGAVYTAGLTGIPLDDYQRSFTARAYVCCEDFDGNSVIVYGTQAASSVRLTELQGGTDAYSLKRELSSGSVLRFDYTMQGASVTFANDDWHPPTARDGYTGMRFRVYNPVPQEVRFVIVLDNTGSYSLNRNVLYTLTDAYSGESCEELTTWEYTAAWDSVGCGEISLPGGFNGWIYIPFSSMRAIPDSIGRYRINIYNTKNRNGCFYIDGFSLYDMASGNFAVIGKEFEEWSEYYMKEINTYNTTGLVLSKISDAVISGGDCTLEIVNINAATDFGAAGDGTTDDTQAIRSALERMSELGGGTVYLPAGNYLCSGKITIPENVLLLGDWRSPDECPAGSYGTVISAAGDELLNENLFMLSTNSGLKGLTVLYPEQRLGNVIPYAATVAFVQSRYFTLENITIAGCYKGIDAGPKYNEIFYFKNVYLAPLNYGIYNSGTSDKSRMEQLTVDISYWSGNALYETGADAAQIKEYSRANTVGMKFYYNDWCDQYNITVRNCFIGLGFYDIFFDGYSFPTNGQFVKTYISDCNTGIYIEQTKIVGVCFSDLIITTSVPAQSGIYTDKNFYGTCQFMNVDICGDFRYPVYVDGCAQTTGAGTLEFVSATIRGYNDSINYAFYMNGGGLSLQNCTIAAPFHHGYVAAPIQGLTELGCSYSGSRDVTFANPAEESLSLNFSAEPCGAAVPSCDEFVYPETVYGASGTELYNVADFGASPLEEDNTSAFANALFEASKTGGTVYIPGGSYKIAGALTVPSGVELRGCYSMQQGAVDTSGTVLYSYYGKGQPDGTPFITLEANSGVRGFSVYYPDQSIGGVTSPYPWTVQSRGDGCWAVNINLINAYYGVDFGSYPAVNGYIDFVSGSPLRKGIFLGSCDGDIWIKNCQFNPNYGVYLGENRADNTYRLSNCEAFIYGDIERLHSLNCFVYQSAIGNHFISQTGKGTSGSLIGLSVDGSLVAIQLDSANNPEFICAQLTALENEGVSFDGKTDIYLTDSFTGTAYFYNSAAYGPIDYIVKTEGGELGMTLVNLASGYGRASLYQSGGRVNMNSVTFHNNGIILTGEALSLELDGCLTRMYRGQLDITNDSGIMPEIRYFYWN